jgi:hypothetical protein
MIYWKVYSDSYHKLSSIFKYDFKDWDNIFENFKVFYLVDDDNNFGWMPMYHALDVLGTHSDKPKDNCYNSLDFFKRHSAKYCGEIGGRKNKLLKINATIKE